MRRIVGAIHIHSVYSDGSGTVEAITEAARQAGLDFILITDHDTLEPLRRYGPHFSGGLFVGFGAEVSPPDNHFLAFGVRENLPPPTAPPKDIVAGVGEAGGMGFLAHPFDRGSRVLKLPSYAWTARDVRGFTGLEIWNMMSDWIGLTQSVPRTLWVLAFPTRSLTGPDPGLLEWWDDLNRTGPVPGFGGQDVHAYRFGPLTVYPYRRSFGMLLTHLRVEDTPPDDAQAFEEALLTALRDGRGFFANHALADPTGLLFEVGGARPGETVPYVPGIEARVQSPVRATWRLVHDGRALPGGGPAWRLPGPGACRLEGRIKGRPWLFTNHVHVND